MLCDICGSKNARKITSFLPFKIKKRKANIPNITYKSCKDCGETYLSLTQCGKVFKFLKKYEKEKK